MVSRCLGKKRFRRFYVKALKSSNWKAHGSCVTFLESRPDRQTQRECLAQLSSLCATRQSSPMCCVKPADDVSAA
jgi:hypothetical protein